MFTKLYVILQNGVRGLMLDMYDYLGDIWLCHSFGGNCYNYTAFVSVTYAEELNYFDNFLLKRFQLIISKISSIFVPLCMAGLKLNGE